MFESCLEVLRPQTDQPLLLWMQERFHTVDGGTARPWDHYSTPHIGAPGGPAEAYQDPNVRELNLMFASRVAKTTFCIGAMLWTAHTAPAPMMLTNATRDLVQDTASQRVWKMADAAGVFGRLPPENRRSKRRVRLPGCVMNTGWAENPRSLADKSAKVIHKGEVDKWRWLGGSKEAHPYRLADERAKEWPDRKILNESTPALAETSLIEPAFESGWGCRFFVPCPHCAKYQRLNLGNGKAGGICFDKEEGRRNPGLAYRTARYVCLHCEEPIGEDARPAMMRRGVWVPMGCDVDHEGAAALFDGLQPGETHHREMSPRTAEGLVTVTRPDGSTFTVDPYRWNGWASATWIRGEPTRDGEIASYQMSSIYALQVGWRDVARKWVEVQGKPGELQNFINSWLGETFRERKQTEEWEALARKLICRVPAKIVPLQASIVTVGIDRQQAHFVLDALAFAPGRLPWVVDYLYLHTLDEVRAFLFAKYGHQDGGPDVPITRALIDVNFHPAGEDGSTIHAWIKETNLIAAQAGLPLKVIAARGANRPLGVPYREAKMGSDSHCPGATLIEVDLPFTQDWLNKLLFGNIFDEPEQTGGPAVVRPIAENDARLRLFEASPEDHQDYLMQLLNDEGIDELQKKTNNVQRVWRRINTNVPNDHRDGTRLALAGLLHATRNGPVVSRAQAKAEGLMPRRVERSGGVRMPDGRNFLINRR